MKKFIMLLLYVVSISTYASSSYMLNADTTISEVTNKKDDKYIIRGVVRDRYEPLCYANVYVKNKENRIKENTHANCAGYFELAVDSLPVNLYFGYVGYQTKKIVITKDNYHVVDVMLFERPTTCCFGGNVYRNFIVLGENDKQITSIFLTDENGKCEKYECPKDEGFFVFFHKDGIVTIHAEGYKPKRFSTKKLIKKRPEPIKIKLKKIKYQTEQCIP